MKNRLANLPSSITMFISANEELPPGADSSWTEWKYRLRNRNSRLRSGTGCCKVKLKGIQNGWRCDLRMWFWTTNYGPPSEMSLLEQECRAADLTDFNDRAKGSQLNTISSMCVDTIRRRRAWLEHFVRVCSLMTQVCLRTE